MSGGRSRAVTCVDASTLAAFIDGRLEPSTRDGIERHLAECSHCYEAFAGAALLVEELSQSGEKGLEGGRSRAKPVVRTFRPWWTAGVGIAATLVSALWINQRWFDTDAQIARQMSRLVAAVEPNRIAEGRLSEPFPWGSPPSPTRGSGKRDLSLAARQASLALQQLAQSHRTAASLRASGVSLVVSGDLDEAVNALDAAVEMSPGEPSAHVDLAAALLERARTNGNVLDAARGLDQAQLALHAGSGAIRAAALFNKALALEAIGNRALAAATWREYLNVDQSGAWADEARRRLALLERPASNHSLSPGDVVSLSDAELARAARESPMWLDRIVISTILPNWAARLEQQPAQTAARIAKALQKAGHATPTIELITLADMSLRWTPGRRRCLRTLIDSLSRWHTAFESGDRQGGTGPAREMTTALGCMKVESLVAALPVAWAAIASGDSARGATLASEAAARAGHSEYWSLQAGLLEALSAVAISESRMSDASDIRALAITAAEKAGDRRTLGRLEQLSGEAADEQGDRLGAWSHFRTALQTLDDAPDSAHRYGVISTLTIAAAHGGLNGAALALSEDMLQSAAATGRVTPRVMALLQRARVRAAFGDSSNAANDVTAARQLVSTLAEGSLKEAWKAEVGWIQGVAMRRHDPVRAIDGLTSAIDYFERADRRFRLAELLLHRGRLYRELADPESAVSDYRRGAAILEDQRPAIRSAQLRISRASEVWGLFSELVDLTAPDPVAALGVQERATARELLDSLRSDQQQLAGPVSELQACLPESAQALVYAALPTRLLIWRVTRGTVGLTDAPVGERELRDLAAAQIRELKAGASPIAGRRLAALLFPATLRFDPAATLVIVPDAALNRVSFAALPIATTGRHLVEATVPMVAPSLTVFCRMSGGNVREPSKAALLIGIDQAIPDAALPPLPGVRSEVEALSRIYPARTALQGADATGTAILAAMPRHGIIHFGGHAEANELHPSQSRFFAAPGQAKPSLMAEDISATPLTPGTIVILAACETAVGRVYAGEGSMSLSRPFLVAGASQVLGTLWNIQDTDARHMMERVHRRLAAGHSAEKALAVTQRELIAVRMRSSAWSGYVVAGGIPSHFTGGSE